ncbi:unnamed protein product [Dracunculus medinensis]|uniref:Nucleolar protein 16 n=1 Tax=Dracunculus medinensis TaxID=318479 RepID=A0A0N4U565_DRAME|nr:unnamed protein product [Dracunculus medinensis]
MRSTKSIKRGGNRKMTRNACACRRKVFQKRMEQMKNLQRNTVFTGAQVKILAVPQPIPKKLKEPKQRTVEEIAERRRFREQKNLEKRFLKQKPSTSEVPKLLISMKNIKEKKVITAVAKVKEPKKEAKRVLQNKPINVPPSKKSKITDEKNKAKQGVDKSISDEEIEKPSKNKISKNIEKTVAKKKASKTISNKDDTSGPIPNAKVLPKIEGSGSYREKNNDPKVRKQEKVSHLKKVVSFVKIAHLSLHLFVFAFSILYLNSSLKKNSLLFDNFAEYDEDIPQVSENNTLSGANKLIESDNGDEERDKTTCCIDPNEWECTKLPHKFAAGRIQMKDTIILGISDEFIGESLEKRSELRESYTKNQTNGFHYEFYEEKEQFGGNFLGKNLETNEMKCLKITIDHSNLTKAHLIKFKIYMQNDGSKGRCNISESSSEMKKKEFQCIGVGIQESFNISFETDENSPQGRNVVGNMPELIDREITNANHEIDGNEEQAVIEVECTANKKHGSFAKAGNVSSSLERGNLTDISVTKDNGKIAQLNYDVNIIKESGKTPQLNYSAVIVDQVKAKHATHVNEVKGVSKGKTTDGDLEMLGEHGLKNDKTSDKSQSHHADDTAVANTVTSQQEKKSYKKFQPVLLAFQKDRPPPLVIERPKREYRLLPRDIEYCTYMMETYGEDYENMIKDKKNVFLDTAKSIQRKIRIFRESPYYADYLKIKKDQQ